MDDPHVVLGLAPDADDETIRRRYLELVRQFSPEHHPEKFAAIRAAYERLRDRDTRVRYRLFEAGRKETIESIVEEIACRSSRRRVSLQDAAERAVQALTPDVVSAVLADFRAWLTTQTSERGNRWRPASRRSSHRSAHAAGPVLGAAAGGQSANAGRAGAAGAEQRDAAAIEHGPRCPATEPGARRADAAAGSRRGDSSAAEDTDRSLRRAGLAGREMHRLRETVLPSLEQLGTATVEPETPTVPIAPPSFWARLAGFARSPAAGASGENAAPARARALAARQQRRACGSCSPRW